MGTLKCFLSSSLFVSLLLMVQRSCVRRREGRSFFVNSQSGDGTLEPNVLSRSVSAVREILCLCVHAGAPPGSFYTKIFFFLMEDASPATSCFLPSQDSVCKLIKIMPTRPWLTKIDVRLRAAFIIQRFWFIPPSLIPQWFSYDLNRVQFCAPDCRAFFSQRN